MDIEATMRVLLTGLAEVASQEGAELCSGAPELVAQAYLFGKVKTTFEVVVPAGGHVPVKLELVHQSDKKGIGLAMAMGLFAGYLHCEAELTAYRKAVASARKMLKPLGVHHATLQQALQIKVRGEPAQIVLEGSARLLQHARVLAKAPPGMSTLSGSKRLAALLTAVTSVLGGAFEDHEIADLVDDMQGGDRRKRIARVYRRRQAAQKSKHGTFEGFLIGSFAPAAPGGTDCR